MRIVLNASPLMSPFTGIGQYTYQLAKGLLATPGLEIDFFYTTGWSNQLREKPIANIATFKSLFKKMVPNSYSFKRRIEQYFFNKGVNSSKPLLYHEPNFLPLSFSCPTIVTVHDLSWIRFPEAHPKDRVRAMNRYFEPNLHRVNSILTDSDFVKRELIDVFNISPERIKSVPLGVESLFHPRSAAETEKILAQHNLKHGHYILSVGTLEPRKNVQSTIKAYMRLKPSVRKRFPLVLIGMKGWHTSNLERLIAPLIRSGEVRQVGYLPREELAILVAGALTMVYPSIYEGFGLPPLESMASGVPVITSNISSLPEVVGDTGYLVDPHDIDALTSAIEALVTSPEIRLLLSNDAYKRSALFSWEDCARQTVGAYHEVLDNL